MERIDIKAILEKRTGRKINPLAVWFLKRIIHQDELNRIWDSGRNLDAKAFLRHTLRSLNTDFEVVHTAHIDPDERYIFVSNHPFGGLDGLMITEILCNMFDDVGVVVNDLLANVEPLRPLWIPVNLYGPQHREGSGEYACALASESKQILTFPAGFCSRRTGGQIADTAWKPRFIRDALLYDRKIVPVYVEGQLSDLFYNIHSLRKFFGIKTNLELVLLVDEMFRQRGRHIRIVLGAPVNIAKTEGSTSQKCQYIRNSVYSLKNAL